MPNNANYVYLWSYHYYILWLLCFLHYVYSLAKQTSFKFRNVITARIQQHACSLAKVLRFGKLKFPPIMPLSAFSVILSVLLMIFFNIIQGTFRVLEEVGYWFKTLNITTKVTCRSELSNLVKFIARIQLKWKRQFLPSTQKVVIFT